MFDKVRQLLGMEEAPAAVRRDDNPLALATAALMVQVSLADGHLDETEMQALKTSMRDDFNISEADAHYIITDATRAQDEATCLYRFTRVITAELDQEGRQEIVKSLWRVALADGVLDNFEANVLAKVAGLLGVTARDRVLLKQQVEAEG